MQDRLEVSGSGNLPPPSDAGGEDLTIGGIAVSRLAIAGEARLPKVSFIVRNWNYGRYIGRTIDSILGQDYPDFEVVIVDNASTDESRDVIARHVGDDPRFRIRHAEVNLGSLGAGLLGLEQASGEFVAFIDSDDTLLSNFASVHIQVHLASRHNIAFTSSAALETGPDGGLFSGSRSRESVHEIATPGGLRSADVVPRLGSIDGKLYDLLGKHTFLLPPTPLTWPWSPGTSNVYRRHILDILRPQCAADVMAKLSADGHFNRLAHCLGGSALIELPLSTYRIHGDNFAASAPSLAAMGGDGGPATKFHRVRAREMARVLVANASDFSNRIGEKRYWSSLAFLFQLGGLTTPGDLAEWNRDGFFDEQVRQLAVAFGERKAIRKLAAFIPRPLLRCGVAALHAGKWPVHAHLELHLSATRRLHARIKRAIRKRRRPLSTSPF